MTIKVPTQTTINKTEPIPDKYAIMFATELINFIKEKQKVKTYRFGLKYDYINVGDTVKIQNSETKEIVGEALVTNKIKMPFKEVPIENEGHESYLSKDHQRQVLSGYYAYLGRPIADDDLFLVFDFKLI